VVNGHIDPDIQKVQANVKFAEPPPPIPQSGQRKIRGSNKIRGARVFAAARVGRSVAYADVLQLRPPSTSLLSTNGGPVLFVPQTKANRHAKSQACALNLSARNPIATASEPSSRRRHARRARKTQMLRSGSSYLSASELVLTFGLGQQTKTDSIEIRWPSGQIEKLSNINASQNRKRNGKEKGSPRFRGLTERNNRPVAL